LTVQITTVTAAASYQQLNATLSTTFTSYYRLSFQHHSAIAIRHQASRR
jgi:hypothetical protein